MGPFPWSSQPLLPLRLCGITLMCLRVSWLIIFAKGVPCWCHRERFWEQNIICAWLWVLIRTNLRLHWTESAHPWASCSPPLLPARLSLFCGKPLFCRLVPTIHIFQKQRYMDMTKTRIALLILCLGALAWAQT